MSRRAVCENGSVISLSVGSVLVRSSSSAFSAAVRSRRSSVLVLRFRWVTETPGQFQTERGSNHEYKVHLKAPLTRFQTVDEPCRNTGQVSELLLREIQFLTPRPQGGVKSMRVGSLLGRSGQSHCSASNL